MELKDFIKQTLIDITNGVRDAQSEIKGSGAYINPEGIHDGENLESGWGGKYRHIQKVKLSIVINASDNSEITGKAGIISVLNLGMSGKIIDRNSSTNRVEIEIPISVPIMEID